MQHTTMFSNNQGPAIEVIDVNLIAQNFASWNFGFGEPYDRNTPQICIMAINEIQNQALRTKHPIRVGFFNIVSDNFFVNKLFEELIFVIINRVGYGVANQEWRSLDAAVVQTIQRTVKACASAMAGEDPDFMATMKEEDQRAVRENSEIWNYLTALAAGQVQFVPFDQMTMANGLTGVSGSTQSALEASRSLPAQGGGGFVENYNSITSSQYNNNGGQNTGRYGRRAEIMHGKLEGSLQSALKDSGAANKQTAPYQSRFSRQANSGGNNGAKNVASASTKSFSQAAAQRFDSDVTNFSKPMAEDNVVTNVEPVKKEELKTLFSVKFGEEDVEIIRSRPEGYSAWKPTRLQRFHPAWCTRTHTVLYFETRNGEVIAVLQILSAEQKEIAMNYDAHAIDPTKGKPAPTIAPKPVREEAKVMYAKATDITVNVTVSENYGMEEDISGALRSTRLKAEMSEKIPEAFVNMSVINTPIIYSSAEEAAADLKTIEQISTSKDFAEAAGYLAQVSDDLARELLNTILVKAVNNAMQNAMGVDVEIDNFIEDGPEIISALARTKSIGTFVAKKLADKQSDILLANVRIVAAAEFQNYVNASLAPAGEEQISEETTQRILLLQRNVCAAWVKYTDNELAIGMPAKGAAPIAADSLGGLFKVAEALFRDGVGKMTSSEQFLITKDGVRYNLHRGLLNTDCYLLTKAA